jgi:hypothetical protein
MTWSFVVVPAEGHHAGVLPTGGLCGVVIESESVGDALLIGLSPPRASCAGVKSLTQM